MNKLIVLAFMAFCNPFEVNCEKVSDKLTLLRWFYSTKKFSQKTEFHFIRTENMNDTGTFFKYDLKSVEKMDETKFKVNCESDLLVDLDNEWHVSFVVWF